MALKLIGYISGNKGYDGTVIVTNPLPEMKKLRKGTKVEIGFSQNFTRTYTINKWNKSKKFVEVKFDEINSKEHTSQIKENALFLEESKIVFEESEGYFIHQLLGSRVIDVSNGEQLGEIIDVWLLPANDVWLMKTKDAEIPLPYIDDVVKEVDLEQKIIKIQMIDGLLELATNEDKDEE